MKKNEMFLMGGCAVVLSLLFATSTNAATADIKTKGGTSFTVPTDIGSVIKPGTDNDIMIDGDQTQIDGVQLLHAPNFNFGQNALKANGGYFDAIYENYKEKSSDTTSYAIPHFVQVGDFSADTGTKWQVNVEQDSLFKAPTEQGHELKLSRIQIHNSTLTNNLKDVSALLTGPIIPSSGYISIPVKGKDGGSLPILTSKASQEDTGSTHGTISSVVFRKNYLENDYGSEATNVPALTDKNTDVKLHVPNTDTAHAKAYSTNLTWTLTVGP